MTVKYGIKIPFEDTELWVMEDTGLPLPDNQRVRLFDTRADAEAAAQIWKTYTIEKYQNNQDFDQNNLANSQKA